VRPSRLIKPHRDVRLWSVRSALRAEYARKLSGGGLIVAHGDEVNVVDVSRSVVRLATEREAGTPDHRSRKGVIMTKNQPSTDHVRGGPATVRLAGGSADLWTCGL
jgi:hypothetical protein